MSWPADADPPQSRRGRRRDDYLQGLAALEHGGAGAPRRDAAAVVVPSPAPGPGDPFAPASGRPAGDAAGGERWPADPADPRLVAAQRAEDRRRSRIARRAPLVALVLPALLAAGAAVALRGDGTAVRGVAGFALALLAAPLLPAAGVPVRTGGGPVMVAAAASAALWMLLGLWAARRMGRRNRPPNWWRWWGEYVALSAGVWGGAVAALLIAQLVLTGALG